MLACTHCHAAVDVPLEYIVIVQIYDYSNNITKPRFTSVVKTINVQKDLTFLNVFYGIMFCNTYITIVICYLTGIFYLNSA